VAKVVDSTAKRSDVVLVINDERYCDDVPSALDMAVDLLVPRVVVVTLKFEVCSIRLSDVELEVFTAVVVLSVSDESCTVDAGFVSVAIDRVVLFEKLVIFSEGTSTFILVAILLRIELSEARVTLAIVVCSV
jgi:hypothetical protein